MSAFHNSTVKTIEIDPMHAFGLKQWSHTVINKKLLLRIHSNNLKNIYW
jgi:hypothetical protein